MNLRSVRAVRHARQLAFSGVVAFCMLAPASAVNAAQFAGHVSVTDGDLAHFEDLAAQFPGTTVSYSGPVRWKGTYPDAQDCGIGIGGDLDPCGGGIDTFPITALAADHLDAHYSTGISGTEPSDFWDEYPLTSGDSILVRFHRNAPGDWVALPVSSVPEPAIWGLMVMGFGLVGASLRRRQGAAVRS